MVDQAQPVISVVVPSYMEGATIVESVERMITQFDADFAGSFEIVVVIDGDVDGTAANLRQIEDPRVRVIQKPRNEGKGGALQDGFRAAKGFTLAQLDADLDLHPLNVGVLHQHMKHNSLDVVVGSKFHRDSKVAYPSVRRIQSRCYQLIVQMLFGLMLSDTQTGVKVFTRDSLFAVLDQVDEKGFVFDLDLLSALSDSGYRLGEGPVVLDYHFDSTLPPGAAVTMLARTVRVWRRAKQRRPQLRSYDS